MLGRTSLASVLTLGGAIVFIAACTASHREPPARDFPRQQKPSDEADQPEPTPDLGDIVALRSYDFRGYFERKQTKIFGADLISLYSVKKEGGRLEFSAGIPNPHGDYVYTGMFWTLPTLDVSARQIAQPVTNGYIWTPRSESAGGVSLATRSEVSGLPGFDLDAFKEHPAVIPFSNGYGVNLYGAVILDGAIIEAGSDYTYVTSNGERLYGRVIEEPMEGGVRRLRETVLE
jgi:hypothetical protein